MQSNTDFVSDENRDVHKSMKSKAYQLTLKSVVHTLIKTEDALKIAVQALWLKNCTAVAWLSLAKELHSSGWLRCPSSQFLLQPRPETFQQVWHLRFVK